ncbi:Ecm9p LALA0_S02e01882g [Lachancea lanzarotensis]|uniref:LALA0S02e01882g1_1 n=1 Tax=Lachancea lanzarotensis TaxID=1245769 RepID=A0A0C7MZ53_9SACH|nr:uncharacterized protein LALA0_S02e01882g [Lachancea lanzarotensis]CEP60885.1 LALA0S02e01882g1_1 [Lachancea lanzarotensis]
MVELCRELFQQANEGKGISTPKLTIIPDGVLPANSPSFTNINDGNSSEIYCSKSTYLKIFAEARRLIRQDTSNALINDEDKYLGTLGLLLITPEDRTALKLHEDLLLKRLQTQPGGQWTGSDGSTRLFCYELSAISLLLTSSVNRVNKSSSLWLLFRKVYALKREFYPDPDIDFSSLFTSSAERHISNYYCWNTFRWVYDLETPAAQTELLKVVWGFSIRHPKDSSAWWALGHVLLSLPELASNFIQNYNAVNMRFEFTKHIHHKQNSDNLTNEALSAKAIHYISKIMTYIETGEVREWPPFGCIVRLSHYVSRNEQVHPLQRWCDEIEAFEEKNFKIDRKSVTMAIYKNNRDLLFQRSIESLMLRKAAIGKVDIALLRNANKTKRT